MHQIATEEVYQDGQTIFQEGSSGDWIYLIESGKVEISKKLRGKKVVIEVLPADEIFGELGFITKTTRSATATAIGETRLGVIDRSFLDEEFNKLSASFQHILASLAMRLRKASENAVFGRKEERFPKVLSVSYKDKESLIRAFSENLSGGGIFVKTHQLLPQGETFYLKLFLPGDAEPLKIECEVAWQRTQGADPEKPEAGMGVRFVKMSRTDSQRLREALK